MVTSWGGCEAEPKKQHVCCREGREDLAFDQTVSRCTHLHWQRLTTCQQRADGEQLHLSSGPCRAVRRCPLHETNICAFAIPDSPGPSPSCFDRIVCHRVRVLAHPLHVSEYKMLLRPRPCCWPKCLMHLNGYGKPRCQYVAARDRQHFLLRRCIVSR